MAQGSLGKTRVLINTGTISEGDSIAAYLVDSAGTLLTSTIVSGKQSLDSNVTKASFEKAEDSVHASGDFGVPAWGVRNDAGTALAADGDYIPLSMTSGGELRVSATITQQGIFDEDSAHTTGDKGQQVLAVRNDAGTSLVSTDLDYGSLQLSSTGRLRVTGGDNEKAEDAASSSGDTGAFVLAIQRNATGSNVSATGDYSELQTNKRGDLRVSDKIETTILQQAISVATTATALPTTALTGRKAITVQAITNGLIFLGSATVTTSGATRGLILGNGGEFSANISDDVTLYGITATSAKDVTILEMA